MTYLSTLVQFLDQSLCSAGYQDSCQNGLQIESSRTEVLKVGLAVDSGLSVFEDAIRRGCQLLIVHHGLFWGDSPNLSGIVGKKVRTLMEGGCSLYASHLPLDGHPDLGNNAELLKALGAQLRAPFCRNGQSFIGFMGELPQPTNIQDFKKKLICVTAKPRFLSLDFGSTIVKSIGVVTGSGSFALREAHQLGADVFITGEPKQNIFHEAKELGLNAMFAGHYATETFGVKAVGRLLQAQFGLDCEFLDHPTDI